MSSRLAEKERRRAERLEHERKQAAADARRRRLRIAGTAAGAVAVAGIAAALIATSGGSKGVPASSQAAFGQHYEGLADRERAAGVPTMMQTMGSSVHFHPTVQVWANGQQVPVPAEIGMDPREDDMQMAGLHTHDTNGTIHAEGMAGPTLGQFFRVWGVALSPSQLGRYRTSRAARVRMWVNGKPSRAFGSLRLADQQRIVLTYGTASKPPAT